MSIKGKPISRQNKNYLTQINVYLLKGHVQDISGYKILCLTPHVVDVIKMSQRTCPEVEMDE